MSHARTGILANRDTNPILTLTQVCRKAIERRVLQRPITWVGACTGKEAIPCAPIGVVDQ
jgi:hypothetical protein